MQCVRFEGHECVHSLTSELIVRTDDRSLGNTVEQDERRLDLCRRETMTRDVDNIYNQAQHEQTASIETESDAAHVPSTRPLIHM